MIDFRPFVSELRYSGRPNRQAALGLEHAAHLRRIVDALDEPVEETACWSECFEEDARRLKCLLILGPTAADVVYLIGDVVVQLDRAVRDTGGQLQALVAPILVAAAAAPPPRVLTERDERVVGVGLDAKKFVKVPRCKHAADYHEPLPEVCECGVPDDYEVWAAVLRAGHNSCYNYAVRDVWCTSGTGATPRAYPSDPYSQAEWAPILATDGLIATSDWTEVPAGMDESTGWHVALVFGTGADFHFLRLDGDHWTHKFGNYHPQACDVAKRPIPDDGLEAAALCEYSLVGYFWVPRPLSINH